MHFDEHWYREGRGRGLDFYACDEELAEVLQVGLPKPYAPYSLVGSYVEKQGREYVHRYVERAVTDFLDLRSGGIWYFFLRSAAITPSLTLCDGRCADRDLSFSGLLNIQHGSVRKGKRGKSRLGIVNKVQNERTNELIVHKEYERVFNALRAAIRKRLVYTSVLVTLDGRRIDSKWPTMTELFAARCQSGELVADQDVGEREKE